jgi:hypothetical protein
MGQFFISTSVLHRASNRIFEVVAIYGPADHSRSRSFLEEISDKVGRATHPLLLGGDFNLIRSAEDKNNDNLNWPLIDLFNEHVASWALREIPRTGARYTWMNRQLNPVRSVLDRVFISPELEALFPLCSLVAETNLGSDHTPWCLTLETGSRLAPIGSSSNLGGLRDLISDLCFLNVGLIWPLEQGAETLSTGGTS